MKEKYQKIKKIVEKELIGVDAVHDVNHVMRVYRWAIKIAESEKGVNLDVLIPAILLHDIGHPMEQKDKSRKTWHVEVSAKMAQNILKKIDYSQEKINKITHCILTHSYRKTGTTMRPVTKQAKILSDADKLDALGAVGVARSCVWVGKNNAKIYTDIPVREYIKNNLIDGKRTGRIKDKTKHSPIIEYETKLKYLPGKLHTKKAKKMAKERLNYMKAFFNRLKKEIKGEN